ncbi:GntR family transcriptional regulator [Falsirhodobacter deserti]|uniref:GntR family transcriptional regulator n=1 Tax=Falsirhodobacter deserti TaxID=1365611 RepID=UPI0013E3C199|nr:GntR family transcriptional regulator [Falsirhodobacter deserti]
MNDDSIIRNGQTQTARAAMTLRDMIVGNQLTSDTRYTEVQLAEMLSMSRTPIRAALQRLTDEGLLMPMPGGGYAIRRLLPSEIADTIELRGTLEGLAARWLAERGIDRKALQDLVQISDRIHALLNADSFARSDLPRYERLNAQFHDGLTAATGSALLCQEIARANNRPFASSSALVGMYEHDRDAHDHLLIGQEHHRAVLESIAGRQGTRAEAIMREHARLSQRNLDRALGLGSLPEGFRGASLILQPQEEVSET